MRTHLIPNLETLDPLPLLHDLAHKLMPADEIRWALEMASVEVQVAAAEGGAADFQDGIGGFLELGVGSVFYCDLIGVAVSSSLAVVLGVERRGDTLKSPFSTTARIVLGGMICG